MNVIVRLSKDAYNQEIIVIMHWSFSYSLISMYVHVYIHSVYMHQQLTLTAMNTKSIYNTID